MKMSIKNFILVIICCGVVGYVATHLLNNKEIALRGKRIAIFEPATHPAIEEIAQGFIDTMIHSDQQYAFTRYNANGNKILMQAQAQDILQQEYDLIFSIGVGCSLSVKELSGKKDDMTPIVFTAVDDPVRLNLHGPHITGVIDVSNYRRQLDCVLQLKPTIKKIVLVFDASQGTGLEKDRQAIDTILQEKNIILCSVEINNLSEIQQKVTGFLYDADLVMILKDNTIVSGIDSLIKLCQTYKVPLLASDLNSGAKGAALAYGIYESDSGVQAAEQAKIILEQGKQPSQVPVIAVEKMIMKVNVEQAQAQGLDIDFANISIADVEIDMKGN